MTLASTLLLTSIPLLVHLYATRYREEDKVKAFPDNPPDFTLPVAETYDFIIVGGGTAGCVLSRRLAEANFNVLLLEAGGDPVPLESVPILSVFQKFHPDINFLYQSTPQKNAALKDGGILKTSAGKMLGGSSSHNDMMYERGHPLGYEEWANVTGDLSWNYANLLQFFKRSEDYMGKYTTSTGQHSVGGPWTISRPEYTPGREVYINAGKELGLNETDSNGPQKVGVASNEFFKKKGRRQDTYTSFVKPVEDNLKTLTVRRYSVVEQILIENQTAVGVVYKRHGVPRAAFSSKEVILSAGAYMSPIILVKSGIGPEDQLKAANVTPVRVSSGVGKNLMDHPFLAVGPFYVEDHSKAWQMEQNLTFADFDTFIEQGDGPMTSSYTVGISEAFIASSRAAKVDGHPDWPDLQIYYEYLGEEPNSVQCYVGFNRPYSRGEILLNTSATGMEDNFLPIIEYNYYTVDSDFDVTIEGIKYCLRALENTTAFRKIGAKFTTTPIPECADTEFRSDDYWRCFIRQTVDSTYHASGTCRMGKTDDPNAVVDSKLRVIGVKNLRVVDASIMPRVTNANTCAPVVMIAEKASYEIIKEYNTSTQQSTTNKPTRPKPPLPFLPGFPFPPIFNPASPGAN